jgi:single-strand DNA-binding protein
MGEPLKNRIQLIGHVSSMISIQTVEKTIKAEFQVSTTDSYFNVKGEKVKETQHHPVCAWGKVAEIAEKYLKKGSEIAIEGRLINTVHLDAGDKIHHIAHIEISEILLLNSNF